ncbi:uncharacterized protein METZ01_LOCUS495266, partial [marine metagenome]
MKVSKALVLICFFCISCGGGGGSDSGNSPTVTPGSTGSTGSTGNTGNTGSTGSSIVFTLESLSFSVNEDQTYNGQLSASSNPATSLIFEITYQPNNGV